MIKNLVKKLGLNKAQKGQSLVEMAIATPILLIMFIGVFEIGWALRGYLVLANANRESARFAVKNSALDYSIKDPATVGYNTVFTHTMASLSSQLPLEFTNNPNSSIIMSHIVADTGIPCATNADDYTFDTDCDCENGDPSDPDGDGTPWFNKDDLIAHPDDPNFPHYIQTFGPAQATRLGTGQEAENAYLSIYGEPSGIPLDQSSFARAAAEVALRNNQFNCTVKKTGSSGEYSIDNVFIAEAFYNQPQLLGLPFISNSVTDPIPFYTHTAMRIVTSRDSDTTDTIGPTCELLPFTFPESLLINPSDPPEQPIEAFEGSDPGNFGWVYWNSDPSHTNGINYIEESLVNPRLSTNDFLADPADPDYPNDTTLNIGDWVSGRTGVGNSSTVQTLLHGYVNQIVTIPVYDTTNGGGGSNAAYHFSHFARVRVEEICFPSDNCSGIPSNEKAIRVTFLKYVDDACTDGSGGGAGGGGNNAPTANDDPASTPDNNTPVTIPVLDNDTDPDGDTLTVDSITQPGKGTATDNGDGTVTYTPKNNPSGIGTFTFTYTISDGNGGTATATVTVIVGGSGNVPPVANNDSGYSTPQDTALNINAANGVLTNDSDFDSDPLTAIKVTDPAHGAVTLNADGSFTYTPTAGYSGSDSFTYKANDGTDDSTTNATVSINVVGNNPPAVTNNSYTVDEDGTLTVNAPGVLNNDSDAESDPLTAIKVSDPGNGTLSFNNDGSFTYTPDANWTGTDTFAYKANDGNNDSATNATVSIIVNPVNDAPVAVDGNFNATENQQLNGQLSFSDVDSVSLTPAAVDTAGLSNAGSLVINADGTFSYTPTGSGTETFTYKVTDSLNTESNIATVTITVAPDTPVLTTLIDEDFENSLTGEWSLGSNTSLTSGSNPHAGNQHLEILKKGSATVNVDMTGVTGDHLTFWYKTSSLDKGTENIEVTVNSNVVLQVYDGDPEEDNTYRYVDIDLSSYPMDSSFTVVFKINGSGTKDYFYIDDVTITGYQ